MIQEHEWCTSDDIIYFENVNSHFSPLVTYQSQEPQKPEGWNLALYSTTSYAKVLIYLCQFCGRMLINFLCQNIYSQHISTIHSATQWECEKHIRNIWQSLVLMMWAQIWIGYTISDHDTYTMKSTSNYINHWFRAFLEWLFLSLIFGVDELVMELEQMVSLQDLGHTNVGETRHHDQRGKSKPFFLNCKLELHCIPSQTESLSK